MNLFQSVIPSYSLNLDFIEFDINGLKLHLILKEKKIRSLQVLEHYNLILFCNSTGKLDFIINATKQKSTSSNRLLKLGNLLINCSIAKDDIIERTTCLSTKW